GDDRGRDSSGLSRSHPRGHPRLLGLRRGSRTPAGGDPSRVRLLFDQNLSHRLVRSLSDVFPDSVHVRDVGLARADDDVVWTYALAHALVIVSKDSDFRQRSFLHGAPPKVVWIRRGNCSTREMDGILRAHHDDLLAFVNDDAAAF